MTTNLPTKSQAAAIAHFARRPFPKTRTNRTTYEACRRKGWIEEIDTGPFHQATPAGIAALDAYERAQRPAPAIDVDRVMRLVHAYGQECRNGTPNGDNAARLLDAIRHSISKEA